DLSSLLCWRIRGTAERGRHGCGEAGRTHAAPFRRHDGPVCGECRAGEESGREDGDEESGEDTGEEGRTGSEGGRHERQGWAREADGGQTGTRQEGRRQ